MSANSYSGARYRAGKRLWNAEDDALLAKRYPHESTKSLAAELRRTVSSVYARADKLGLQKSEEYLQSPDACRLRRGDNPGAAYQFKRGHVPANKGLRRPGWAPGRMAETQFKRGQRNGVAAMRYMAVGSTRLVDGYVYRKVADVPNVSWTRNWVLEHRRVWEEANGAIPKDHVLVFLNGDKLDIGLHNLECITHAELLARNSIHNLPAELANTIQLLGALNRQINRKRKTHEK
jgi:hypothetical protein